MHEGFRSFPLFALYLIATVDGFSYIKVSFESCKAVEISVS